MSCWGSSVGRPRALRRRASGWCICRAPCCWRGRALGWTPGRQEHRPSGADRGSARAGRQRAGDGDHRRALHGAWSLVLATWLLNLGADLAATPSSDTVLADARGKGRFGYRQRPRTAPRQGTGRSRNSLRRAVPQSPITSLSRAATCSCLVFFGHIARNLSRKRISPAVRRPVQVLAVTKRSGPFRMPVDETSRHRRFLS